MTGVQARGTSRPSSLQNEPALEISGDRRARGSEQISWTLGPCGLVITWRRRKERGDPGQSNPEPAPQIAGPDNRRKRTSPYRFRPAFLLTTAMIGSLSLSDLITLHSRIEGACRRKHPASRHLAGGGGRHDPSEPIEDRVGDPRSLPRPLATNSRHGPERIPS